MSQQLGCPVQLANLNLATWQSKQCSPLVKPFSHMTLLITERTVLKPILLLAALLSLEAGCQGNLKGD